MGDIGGSNDIDDNDGDSDDVNNDEHIIDDTD